MDSLPLILLLYGLGLVLLIVELFVPSHGLITLAALTCLGIAVYRTFVADARAGFMTLSICLVVVPLVFVLGIKYIRYLPMGRYAAPPNPQLTSADLAFDVQTSAVLIGRRGRAVTPLHPVGVCEFDGRRVQCVCESGMIEAGVAVVGLDVQLNNLVVRPVEPNPGQTGAGTPA